MCFNASKCHAAHVHAAYVDAACVDAACIDAACVDAACENDIVLNMGGRDTDMEELLYLPTCIWQPTRLSKIG